jgi:regulator of CtrA degradation
MGTSPSLVPEAEGFAATAFFSKTYDEAEALLLEARAYMEFTQSSKWSQWAIGLLHDLEAMRVTARLTNVMAWLLAQRAVSAREITPGEARGENYRLGGHRVCLDAGNENSPAVSDPLRALLRRSRELYQRVARLDEMISREIG